VEQIPVFSFKASDLTDVEVGPYTATFDFGSEIVEITGTPAELVSVKALVDAAAAAARGIY
jgi:hypothetical protein